MKQFIAFIHKEYLELHRGGKLFLLLAIALIFGLLSPALAKLTPVLFEALGEELAEQGMLIQEITVTALTSWSQFYKNLSIVIILPAIFFGGTMAYEYQKGTLINLLTKGLERWKVIISKFLFMTFIWTVFYLIVFLTTYFYTDFYWDNSIVENIIPAALGIYFFGIMLMALVILGGSLTSTATSNLLLVGGIYIVMYILSAFSKIASFIPVKLLSMELITAGGLTFDSYGLPLIVTLAITVLSVCGAVMTFSKRRL